VVGGWSAPVATQDRGTVPCGRGRATTAVVIGSLLSPAVEWLSGGRYPPRPGVSTTASMGPMDDVALRYLLLALRIGRHVPELVGWYSGPPELAEAVAGEDPAPPAELHGEALALADVVAELPTDTPSRRRRATWLAGQLTALSALARRAAGEEIDFVDLVEELNDVQVRPEPESAFDGARAMVDAALPGSGALRDRLAAHDQRHRIPRERVIEVVSAVSAMLRARTHGQLWLPHGESVDFEAVTGVDGDAETRYLGAGRSSIRINLDRSVTLADAVELAAHHAYPGHHAEAAIKDNVVVEAGGTELSLAAHLSPQSVISEGMASLAREVVMSDAELGFELLRLARALRLRVDVEAELLVQRARRLLAPALGNAALALHMDGQPLIEVRTYLAEVALVGDDRLAATISLLTHPAWRAHAFTVIEGRRLVSEWLELEGQTHGFNRLLREQLSPAQLRIDIGQRSA